MEKPRIIVSQEVLGFIRREGEKAKHARIAVAFARRSGLVLLENMIDASLRAGGKWDFIVGLDFSQTEGEVLKNLLQWSNRFKDSFSFVCYSDPSINRAPTFHPKVYIFETLNKAAAMVGSSNLTSGGLSSNVEANIALHGTREEIEETGLPAFFANLKYQPSCFTPTEQYIDRYDFIRKRVVKASRKVLARPSTKKEVEKLQKQEQELVVKPRDPATLTGRQKWIYDRLPEDQFKTSDLYRYEEDLLVLTPTSKTPRNTMRRVLQELRDEGILIHLEKGLWKRRV